MEAGVEPDQRGAATQHPVDQCGLQITVQYHRSDAAGTGGEYPGA